MLNQSAKEKNAVPFEVFKSYQKHLNTVLKGHFDVVLCVCFISFTQVVSGGGDGFLRIWDVDSSICLGKIEAH